MISGIIHERKSKQQQTAKLIPVKMQRATDPPRFQLFNDEELANFIDNAESAITKKQIRCSVSVFEDYCNQAGVNYNCEHDNAALDKLISKLYAGVRNNSDFFYSTKSTQALRFGLQRHFMSKRGEDIIRGRE